MMIIISYDETKLEPNMLKILLIIPSNTSQKNLPIILILLFPSWSFALFFQVVTSRETRSK